MIPNGSVPFGLETVGRQPGGHLRKQDADAKDDVAGPGNGFVDVYDTAGHPPRRLAQHGALNSPWGIAKAPQGFGPASGALLVGNFGNGRINAYDLATGKRLGALWAHGQRVRIPGLWALKFGNGGIGTPKSLLFTAGPAHESHGLFGKLTAASPSP